MGDAAAGRPDAGLVHDEAGLARFLGEFEEAFHDLRVRTGLCWWEKYTGGPGADLDQLERERSELLLDPSCGAVVEEWSGRAADPLLRRKLQVLRDLRVEALVESAPEIYTLRNEIMNRIVAFRPVVYGREVSNAERGRILQREPDRALRREAWMSIAPLSMEVASATTELMRRRNALARKAGYGSYVDLALGLASFSRAEVTAVIAGLERASADTYRAALAEAGAGEGLDEVELWDLSYLIEKVAAIPAELFPRQRIVPALEDFVRSFGHDPAELGIKIVYQDIPYGGLCLAIDPPRDVRVLANPQDGHNYFATLFHEYGHSLHSVFAGENPPLLQEEPGVFAEGMAEVWSWFSFCPDWLRGLGLDPKLVARVRKARGVRMALRHRSLSASVLWEYQAYDDPARDLTALHTETESRFLLTPPRPVHRWAGVPFPAGYPVYWQNYIMADLVAAATHRALRENYGDKVAGNPAVFSALAETYWHPGASKPWRAKLADLTGRDLDPSALSYSPVP